MNLLPKNHGDFAQKDYWDSFFKKRGKEAFEWYGEYPELCDDLHKYVKIKDNVLIVGCGNSVLGNDLYDVGFKNLTSIDISKIAIKLMNNLNAKARPDMKFLEMDATNTSFADSSFNAIIDKGTLDALMPDSNEETKILVDKYFNEMIRILNVAGRFICISLLQKHILDKLLDYFPKHNCMIRIVRCFAAEKKAAESGGKVMPVFIIICIKFQSLPNTIIEINLTGSQKMERFNSVTAVAEQVTSIQQSAFICSALKNTKITDENISFDMHEPGSSKPRFTIFVTDIQPNRNHLPYAAFIVPQGRELEWLFASVEGRKQLATMSKCNRLAICTLHRNQTYESLDAVKIELEDSVRNLAPAKIGSGKIPFLSLGPDVGERKILYEGYSEFSGDYVVEDVCVGETKFRRLFYMSSQLTIQSEAKLKLGKSRNGTQKETIDVTYLTCEHHIYISVAIHMSLKGNSADHGNTLLIGLGGGGLCSFLRKFVPKLSITAIDIDPDMLKVAKDWFGLSLDNKMEVIIKDGLEYLAENGKKYNNIVFDIDSKDQTIGMSCPPKIFLEDTTLKNVVKALEHDGIFILNVVLRNDKLRPNVLQSLKKHFKTITSYKLEKDLNEIFFCFVNKLSEDEVRKQFTSSSKEINSFFKSHKHNDLLNDISDALLVFS